ncbi:MAG: type II secretion system F family protein [Candidatus Eisenbacteria sp.]|nr:type II secretion system F family protein [Candidatus Eisenbacteria bacterium]
MPVYLWKGKDGVGKAVSGEESAKDRPSAIRRLRKRKIIATQVREKPKDVKISLGRKKGVAVKDLAVFTRQFATMINAGLPIVLCLDVMAKQVEKPVLREVLTQVKESVQSGGTLSDSLSKHTKVFDELYSHMVEAGESSGALDAILERLAEYLEKAEQLRRRIKSAMMYPTIVTMIALLATSFLLIFVIPTFTKMFSDFGGQLPLVTRIVVAMSDFLIGYWWLLLALILGGRYAFMRYRATEKGREKVDRLLLKMPVLGTVLRKGAVARFTRTLGTLQVSGVPILEGLSITARTAGNVVLEKAILNTRDSVSRGETLTEPLKESGVFPPMVVQMVAVGEETGALDQMLTKIAEFYEDEVDTAVDGLTSVIEPVMMVFLGGLVGGMVIAMYLPIFKMITVIIGD